MTLSTQEPTAEMLTEAARWFVLLASGEATEAEREGWRSWLAADPRHKAGWQRAETAMALFADIPREQAHASIEALERRPALRSRKRRRVLGSIAGLLASSLIGWQGWRRSDWSADHYTAIGEQRSLHLADGSVLLLDTDSAIDLAFSSQLRLIHLRRGRLSLTTAPANPSPRPPLMVQTAEGRVQALGTRFTVQQSEGSTRVAVQEARVAIHLKSAADPAPVLSAGESARFDRFGLSEQRAAHPHENAWTQGMLIADDLPLAELIAELARYRQAPLIVDPSTRDLRISGTYPLADTDRALSVLADILPVRILPLHDGDPGRGQIIVRRR